ncbi:MULTISPECIES: helix-turn-helix domain-containing protein [Sphingobacterium]|jgi:AraC family transcriptional regulator, transcriptional activator of the genes for pyochelin and ferripyochelin receptors|uniref:helix-turn-helix domain-containing protein n=1 Tax=Sphingobacterium TaxID=28453 RepID=UPI00257BC952|nr:MULTISPECIES: AraC family transcriptional regulator [Sphingobacterium]
MGFEFTNEGKPFKMAFDEESFKGSDFKDEVFKIKLSNGELSSKQWIFDGIKILYAEANLDRPAELDWTGDTELVSMHFNLQGSTSIQQDGMNGAFELKKNQHNLFYGTQASGKMRFDELKMKSFMIQFQKDAFLDISKNGNESLKRFADSIVAGKPILFSKANLNIDLSQLNCIHSILNCNYTADLKKLFFLSKTIELLVLQAESFNTIQHSNSAYLKYDHDRERIIFARDYLVKNMESPPSLIELAKIAGLNEYKLKRGFKEVFHQTAFSYLSDLRLELAKNQLLEGKKPVTEIAFEMGYCSLQHFSTAFKKKFAVSPSQVK